MNPNTVLIIGLVGDPNIVSLCRALEHKDANFVIWNQRHLLNDFAFRIEGTQISGFLVVGNEFVDIESISSVYVRLSEIELTPEFQSANEEVRTHITTTMSVLGTWLEIAPIPIVNRSSANESNSVKAYQAQIISNYIPVPDTLVTNDLDLVSAFWQQHKRIIYKSGSGERSIVTELDKRTLDLRGSALKYCPVLFQRYIEGTDIRVHVVGERVYATQIKSVSSDYRYDSNATWIPTKISSEVELACIQLTQAMGLSLSGIDLRVTNSGEVYCFEVNPSPAFSVYEEQTGQSISAGIADFLTVSKS